jgi:hypothetical protein
MNRVLGLCAVLWAYGVFAHAEATSMTLETDEVGPAPSHECFRGAYYRKAVSSVDLWTGIEGVIVLPEPEYDDSRRSPRTGRFLDNASVYMGGRADKQEIDCGLSWEVIREADGSVSTQGKAFRPFWRNEKWNSGPAKPEYYYMPGDTVAISCATTEPGKLSMEVRLLERGDKDTTLPKTSVFSTVFDAKSFGPGVKQEFKRVNAIDQSGNEGKDVQPTQTIVRGAVWKEVWLVRQGRKLPMIPARFTDMRCPDAAHVVVKDGKEDSPAEEITITGMAGEAGAVLP